MKRNIFENEKIDYIENENEAIEYLKLFDYSGSVLMLDDKTFSLDNLKINNLIIYDDVLRLKIRECYRFEYINTILSSNTTYPQECYSFGITSCEVKNGTEQLKINTSCKNDLNFLLINGETVLNVQDSSATSTYTSFDVRQCDFTKIIYNTSTINSSIKISQCKNIKSFTDLVIPQNVFNLEIFDSRISTFEHFATKIKNVFKFDTRHVKNFLHCDKIDANELDFILYNVFDNIINIIINDNCEVISLTYNIRILNVFEELVDILEKYIEMNKNMRKDHIMDCAIELIDAGFEKAAEI